MSAKKTGGNSGRFAKGTDPRRGGGKPGKSGRKPDEFKERCRQLAENAIVYVAEILSDPSHAQFMRALQWASEYGHGKPAQPLEHSGPEGAPLYVVHVPAQFAPDEWQQRYAKK